MRREDADDIGKLLLRMTVGFLLLFHAYGFMRGDPGIPNAVAAWGLPGIFAEVGFLLELIGAVLIILGVYTRAGALSIVTFMVIGLIMYHVAEITGLRGSGNHLFMLGKNPAGTHPDKYFLETQMFYLFGGLAVALLGSGRYSVRPSK
ncbi:MAG: putative oxidoreductase [Gammaproteobacteria bacterium]|jgi:putative oxidoreductase|nr:putative oxidoreductase [Gammaproteobacteria bacterium]